MERSVLSIDLDTLVVKVVTITTIRKRVKLDNWGRMLGEQSVPSASHQISGQLNYRAVNITSLFNYYDTHSALGHLKGYLAAYEYKYSQHISSCYFYHAAIPFPQQLIYAAEILCLLVGAKPVVLVSE